MSTEIETLDPGELDRFIAELRAAGFSESNSSERLFEGPLETCLEPFTDARHMSIFIHDSWPYRQPSVIVSGIDWWHAAHEMPCLWQEGDNTKRWLTFDGIRRRLEEWAELATRGFDSFDGAALDPHLYFDSYCAEPIGIDESSLVQGLNQDGQHQRVHLVEGQDGMLCVAAGLSSTNVLSGRWFYRSMLSAPAKSLADFEAALTDKQRTLVNKQVGAAGAGIFILIWPTPHGLASLILYITEREGPRRAFAAKPTPTSQVDRLRRAGPDAAVLLKKRIAIFGLGAIGSHVGSLLSRSGAGYLRVVDGDGMTPSIAIRHAAARVNTSKVAAFNDLVRHFDWTVTDQVPQSTWSPSELATLIADCDLCIDATGNSLFAELLSRVALRKHIPMVSVAIYRGGNITRVRRQAGNDQPIATRHGHWKYPPIPAGDNAERDYVGVETGCTAPIHNASPRSVMAAASLATAVSVDVLTARFHEPDEVIEVLSPIEAPFERLGRFTPRTPMVMLTDDARAAIAIAATRSHPNETGGILIGLTDAAGVPCVVRAVELAAEVPAVTRYTVPDGLTDNAIDQARRDDDRLGYLGEWHSHPTDQPASHTDRATMSYLSTASDTSTPVLLVLRPRGEMFEIDAYLMIDGELRSTTTLGIGPLEGKSSG